MNRFARVVLVSALVIACEPPGPGPQPPSPQPFPDRCDETSITQQPDLMGMSMDFRANVTAMRQQGVLAVRYAAKDCDVTLEVLPNCIGPGAYTFSPYAGNESKTASTKLELFAKIPLGAASLEGKLANGKSLRTDYMLAGTLTLPIGQPFDRSALKGQDCDRATHIVNRVYIGGFALAAGQTRSILAAATVFGAGFGVGHDAQGEVIASEGIREDCIEAQKSGQISPQCAAPLRLGLQALTANDPNAYAPDQDGFVPLLVVDGHGCRANEEVWNGTRCESLSSVPATPTDTTFRDEHGCLMGKEVWFAEKAKCVPADGDEIWRSLQLKTQPQESG